MRDEATTPLGGPGSGQAVQQEDTGNVPAGMTGQTAAQGEPGTGPVDDSSTDRAAGPKSTASTSKGRDSDKTTATKPGSFERATDNKGAADLVADAGVEKAASTLQNAAGAIREKAGQEGLIGKAGEKVAMGAEGGATYLRDRDSQQVAGDVAAFVREHPIQAMGGAILVGYLLGRIFR